MNHQTVLIDYVLRYVDRGTRAALARDKAIRDAGNETARSAVKNNNLMAAAVRRFETAAARSAGRVIAQNAAVEKSHNRVTRAVVSVGRQMAAFHGKSNRMIDDLRKMNIVFQALRNTMMALRFPAVIAGIGFLIQALGALTGGVVAVTGALGPLSGALVAIPAAAGAAAQSIVSLNLAFGGISETIKAFETAQLSGGRSARAAAKEVEAAAERVHDAERRLTRAKEERTKAEENVTRASREARRELVDVALAAEGAANSELRARLALNEALAEQDRIAADASASALERESAALAVVEAETAMKVAAKERGRAVADATRAERADVAGSDTMRAAREEARRAVEAQAEAERDLRRAREEAKAGPDPSGGADRYAALYERLSKEAKSFVDFWTGTIVPVIQNQLAPAAGRKLFPGLEDGLRSAMKNLAPFKRVLEATGGAFGSIARAAGNLVGDKGFGQVLERLGLSNAAAIEKLGKSGVRLAGAFVRLLDAARPFTDWLVDVISKWMDMKAAMWGSEQGQKRFAAFLEKTKAVMIKVSDIAGNLKRALSNIFRGAAPLGRELLDIFERTTQRWADWTKSAEGKNKIRKYFKDIKPAILEISKLFGEFVAMIVRVSATPGVAKMAKVLRTDLLPVLEDTIVATTDAFGPAFIKLIASLLKLFQAMHEPLKIVLKVLTAVLEGVTALLENVPFAKQLVAAFLGFAIAVKAVKFAGAILGINKMIAGVAKLRKAWVNTAKAANQHNVAAQQGVMKGSREVKRGQFLPAEARKNPNVSTSRGQAKRTARVTPDGYVWYPPGAMGPDGKKQRGGFYNQNGELILMNKHGDPIGPKPPRRTMRQRLTSRGAAVAGGVGGAAIAATMLAPESVLQKKVAGVSINQAMNAAFAASMLTPMLGGLAKMGKRILEVSGFARKARIGTSLAEGAATAPGLVGKAIAGVRGVLNRIMGRAGRVGGEAAADGAAATARKAPGLVGRAMDRVRGILRTLFRGAGRAAGTVAAETAASTAGSTMGSALDRNQGKIAGGRWKTIGKLAGRAFGLAAVAAILYELRDPLSDALDKIFGTTSDSIRSRTTGGNGGSKFGVIGDVVNGIIGKIGGNRGGGWIVPGDPRRDSTLALLAGDEAVLTGSGQQMMETHAPGLLDAVISRQAPHFRGGGYVQRFRAGGRPGPTKENAYRIRAAARRVGFAQPNILWGQFGAESNFGSNLGPSSAGAAGPMQFMPATARSFGVNPMDWDSSFRGAAAYMKKLLRMFRGRMDWAIAGYNAGEGNVQRYGGIPPFPETQAYVPRVRRLSRTYPLEGVGGTAAPGPKTSRDKGPAKKPRAATVEAALLSPRMRRALMTPSIDDAVGRGFQAGLAGTQTLRQLMEASITEIADIGGLAPTGATATGTKVRPKAKVQKTRRKRDAMASGADFKPGGGWAGTENLVMQAIRGLGAATFKRAPSHPASLKNPGSDHNTAIANAFAADIPALGARGDRIFDAIRRRVGINAVRGSWNKFANKPIRGFRSQLLWYAPDGSHRDHVHFGVRKMRRGGMLGGVPRLKKGRRPTAGMRRKPKSGKAVGVHFGPGGAGLNELVDASSSTAAVAALEAMVNDLNQAPLVTIISIRESIRDQLETLTKKPQTKAVVANIARLRGALSLVDEAAGYHFGQVARTVTDNVSALDRQRTAFDHMLRAYNVDGGSSRAQAALAELLKAQVDALAVNARALHEQAVIAGALGYTDIAQQLDAQVAEMQAAINEAAVSAMEAARAAVLAAAQELVSAQQLSTSLGGFRGVQGGVLGGTTGFGRLELEQQLNRTFDTAAGRTQRAEYLRSQIIPALQTEVGGLQNQQLVALSVGDQTLADQIAQAIADKQNQVLEQQLAAQQLIEQNTAEAAASLKEFTGSIAYEFRGQQFTDLIGSGVGV